MNIGLDEYWVKRTLGWANIRSGEHWVGCKCKFIKDIRIFMKIFDIYLLRFLKYESEVDQ